MFKKIPSVSFTFRELGVSLHDGVSSIIAFDKSSVQLGSPVVIPISGLGAGEPLADTKLSPSRLYTLEFGVIKHAKSRGLLLPSPFLTSLPLLVGASSVIVYGQEARLFLTISTAKQIQLSDFDGKALASLFLVE